jgi:Fe-S oxidoreductase
MKDDLRRCFASQCDFCREGCASYQAFNLDSYSPRGKNRIVQAYHDGRIEFSDLMNLAFKCMVCGQCSEICITGDGIYNNILELRVELVRQGFAPKQVADMKKKIVEKGSPFDKKNISWANESRGKHNVGYFPGCSLLAFNPDLAFKTLDVLESYGIRAVPIVSQCCSSPLLRTGFAEEAKSVGEQLLLELKRNKVKTLICSCPGCSLTFQKDYPTLVKGWKMKIMHISEVLARKKIAPRKERREKIIYHDPCHLSRGLDITSEPRKILRSLGYEILEFKRNCKKSSCCGAGGGAALLYPDEVKNVARLKVDEALDAGADVLASFCPLCEHVLGWATKDRIEVRDVLELL